MVPAERIYPPRDGRYAPAPQASSPAGDARLREPRDTTLGEAIKVGYESNLLLAELVTRFEAALHRLDPQPENLDREAENGSPISLGSLQALHAQAIHQRTLLMRLGVGLERLDKLV